MSDIWTSGHFGIWVPFPPKSPEVQESRSPRVQPNQATIKISPGQVH
jgi:hypothetical protein